MLVETRPQLGLGRNLTHGLFEKLGSAIVAGAYQQEKLPTEAKLAEQHGVSRSVAREAVKMLTSKGLLSARPRQGTVVQPRQSWSMLDPDILRWLGQRQNSVDLLRDLNQLRSAIEPEGAALAAVAARDDDILALSASLAAMEADSDGYSALDARLAFHTTVLRASANPFYAGMNDVVTTALKVASWTSDGAENRKPDPACHVAVRDAIARGDAVAARRTMRALIPDTR